MNQYDDINAPWQIFLKTRSHAMPASRFVVERIIEGSSVCEVFSRITEAMVEELTVYVAANIIELFVKTRCLTIDLIF